MKSDIPFFSIVIPTYNREFLIKETINSITNQIFQNFEIIVVDDGSTDNTFDIISSLPIDKIKYFRTENFGVAHARNYGIKKAIGSYIGFLDSDDFMKNDHLQTAYNLIVEKDLPEIIHLNFSWCKANDMTLGNKNKLPSKLPDDLFNKCSLHVNCIFIKNSIAKGNLFNESRELMFAEDWDFFIKLAVRYKIHLFDKQTSCLVDHDERSTKSFDTDKWIKKRNAIACSLSEDEVVGGKFHKEIKKVQAHMNSLIAVNLACRAEKTQTIKFMFLCLKMNPFEIFSKRFLAIFKHFLFTWRS